MPARQPAKRQRYEFRRRTAHFASRERTKCVRPYTRLEMLAQFGEAAYDQQLLALGGLVYFFVFQDPGVAVGNEDCVQSCR